MKISFFILSFIFFSPVNSYASEQFKATNPDVSITLTTSNPPTVPSSGGSFDYKIAVSNEEPTPVTFDVWTYVILPEGEKHGPVIGPKNIHLPSGVSISARDDLYSKLFPGAMILAVTLFLNSVTERL